MMSFLSDHFAMLDHGERETGNASLLHLGLDIDIDGVGLRSHKR
jgi:hypothetical protein